MTYESAFISDRNQVLLQYPDYFAYGSVRYILSYEGNISYSVGIGLPNLQVGIQKNLINLYGMPVNLKLSGGTAGVYSLNIDGKILIGVFKNSLITVSTEFGGGGHTPDFFKIREEQYLETGMYFDFNLYKNINLGCGMGISWIFYKENVLRDNTTDPIFAKQSDYYDQDKTRMTWQLAGTITYFFGNK